MLFPVFVVVGAAVPAVLCRWGPCPRCPSVGRCLAGGSGVNISSPRPRDREAWEVVSTRAFEALVLEDLSKEDWVLLLKLKKQYGVI